VRCSSFIIPLLELPSLVDTSCGLEIVYVMPDFKRCETWVCSRAGGLFAVQGGLAMTSCRGQDGRFVQDAY
jgi:hypothetical protein